MLAYCFLFLLTFLTNLRPSIQQYMPEYAGYVCPPGRPTYLKSSTYSNNLQTLLSSLSSIDSKFFSTGFQNLTVGENPDMVYGLYLCRGDLSRQECCECVSFACNDILRQCPYVKEAWINYDKCMLGYANWNILLNLVPVMANQSDEFNKVLISLLNELVEEVVASPRKFAFKKKKYTSSQSVYALGQCTPYVTKETCSSCLQQAIKNLSYNTHIKFGERPMWPSCDLRYESYLFYNDSFAQPPLPPPKHGKGKKSVVLTIEIAMPIALSTLLFIACYCFRAKRAKKTYDTRNLRLTQDGDDIKTAGSLQFDFKVIEAATDKFSLGNKLGQGGFGVVYKGTFPNGLQVAVKRLSKKSGQGEREFKNEVIVVAKFQHKNLVRLLGFCFDREEKLLVYEFAHNKSLDYFLFESALKSRLDWTMRYKIIGGIARGILYLHQDSRLRCYGASEWTKEQHLTIIHHDLKAANILLDAVMNPKVADFGMARIFEFDQTEANTRRVAGTYGYMSPEYAMYGQFSMKSDVYSFGVLVLEIISSKKNSSLYTMDGSLGNLVTYTWRLWSNGSPLELVDSSFRENYERNEIIRCIHIALLCVQEDADDRPMMSVILQMLTTSSIALAAPRPPGHLFRSRHAQAGPSTDKSALCSIDEASITTIAPR